MILFGYCLFTDVGGPGCQRTEGSLVMQSASEPARHTVGG
jgi:hypothetical protein